MLEQVVHHQAAAIGQALTAAVNPSNTGGNSNKADNRRRVKASMVVHVVHHQAATAGQVLTAAVSPAAATRRQQAQGQHQSLYDNYS